jgi:hypothetical protein
MVEDRGRRVKPRSPARPKIGVAAAPGGNQTEQRNAFLPRSKGQAEIRSASAVPNTLKATITGLAVKARRLSFSP